MQRGILFDIKDEIVVPTNETVAQVFARISAWRDSMDGPQVHTLGQIRLLIFFRGGEKKEKENH